MYSVRLPRKHGKALPAAVGIAAQPQSQPRPKPPAPLQPKPQLEITTLAPGNLHVGFESAKKSSAAAAATRMLGRRAVNMCFHGRRLGRCVFCLGFDGRRV